MMAFRIFALLLLPLLSVQAEEKYNPLAVSSSIQIHSWQGSVKDPKLNRAVPLHIFYGADRAPVILFSHGLGGSNQMGHHLGEHWARRGYTVVYLQHPGSDESVWKNKRLRTRMNALEAAASPENLKLRIGDVGSVIRELEVWNKTPGHPLHNRCDLEHLGMSGHSFGAMTTQAVSGQKYPVGDFTLPQIDAAILFSPSSPKVGGVERAFGSVRIPWLLITGTRDVGIIGGQTAATRQAVYPALSSGNKYEVVFDEAEHMDVIGPAARRGKRSYQEEILALTTAFWDAYLKEDPGASAWLKGTGPKSVLDAKDRWQSK